MKGSEEAAAAKAKIEAGETAREMKGAEMVFQCLLEEGVDIVFGFPGGAIMPVYDALLDAPGIRHILVRHEQGAAHAADGYARATGKVGVCIATSGPGATNLVTGVATAFLDSSPLLAITGQVHSHLIGTDAFQEADVFGLSFPITKHSYLIRRTVDIPRIFAEAFHIARSGRPGPVWIDIPKDIQLQKAPYLRPDKIFLPGYIIPGKADPKDVEAVFQALASAKRPVLYVGGGALASDASETLMRFVRMTGIPVTTTLMGIGAFPSGHELSLGMLGMHGALYTNKAVSEADLLIACGARFDDRVTGKKDTFARRAKIIQIDIDPAEVSKNVPVHLSLIGDLKLVLEQLMERIEAEPRRNGSGSSLRSFADWRKTIDGWKGIHPLPYYRKESHGSENNVSPRYIIEELGRLAGPEAIVTTDVGQHQMWAAQYCPIGRPRSFITSGGLGTMGFGFPAAIGVKMKFPDRPVICITGDGSFQMNIQELTTAVSQRLGIVVALFDNQALGMVRQWQHLFHSKRYSSVDLADNPDFVKVAEAFGGFGRDVRRPEDVTPAISEALGRDRPTVLRFRIRNDENVFPIVPGGASNEDAIGGDSEQCE
jgi:acetolactate synthase-1/2/3 large subunit